MDEMVLAMLGSLVEIRTELGLAVYESAIERARLAIAAEVIVEAERRAIAGRRCTATENHAPGMVIAFRANPRRGSSALHADGGRDVDA